MSKLLCEGGMQWAYSELFQNFDPVPVQGYLDHAIRQIVSQAIAPGEVIDIFAAAGLNKPDLSILSEDFLNDIKNMPQRNLAVEMLRKLLDDEIKLVTLTGKAGSGKTLLALAAALECRTRYRQILLARPIVPLSNRDLGFLPGDVAAKIDPYMQPLYDNLGVIKHQHGDGEASHRIQDLLDNHKLEITPLAYIRGRSLQRMFFIVDEAQNLTPHEIKTIITRAGEGTKIVFTGDIYQIDHPYLDSLSNGLSYLISRMVGQPIYAHITLEKGERSALSELASDLL